MPRFAANLSLLFTEAPFLERFGRAAAAGFTAVECQFPYAHPAAEVADALQHNGLELVLHNLPAGGPDERGIAILPGRQGEFQDSVGQALEYARALRCTRLNCLAGIVPDRADRDILWRHWTENLRFAARETEKAGVRLMIEAINTRDIPGFYLTHTEQAAATIEAVGSSNVFIQYDVYHMQIMEGDLTHRIEQHLDRIGHIQIADTPGRHEPGTGEINFGFLLPYLDSVGYTGWVGCEYKPRAGTEAGLGWLGTLGGRPR